MKLIDNDMMDRYLRGESDAEEKHKVLMWLMLNLKSSSADEDFAELLEKAPATDDPVRKSRAIQRIHNIISVERKHARTGRGAIAILSCCMAAACALIFFLVSTLRGLRQDIMTVPTWSEVTTSYGQKMELELPDGSHIWLHNDSRIVFPDRFTGGRRQVFIEGEIYADIAKDESCPFVVSSDSVNVIVKGTRFNFRSYPDMNGVELTLVEGSVDMEYLSIKGKGSLSVLPGETIAIDLTKGNVNKYVTKAEEYVSWKDRRVLYFNDLTLFDIVAELQREFNVRIVIQDKALALTRHFASFVNDESPIDILKVLCSESGIKVSEKDSVIYIYNN